MKNISPQRSSKKIPRPPSTNCNLQLALKVNEAIFIVVFAHTDCRYTITGYLTPLTRLYKMIPF